MTLGDRANGRVLSRVNGYTTSNRQSAVYLNPGWNGSQPNLPTSTQDAPAQARFPHIKDLQAKVDTTVQNIDTRIPVCHITFAYYSVLRRYVRNLRFIDQASAE